MRTSASVCAVGEEPGLELRRRKEDAPLAHGMEEAPRSAACRDRRTSAKSRIGPGAKKSVSSDPARVRQRRSESPSLAIASVQQRLEERAAPFELRIGRMPPDLVEHRDARRRRERVPRERPRLVDGTDRSHALHQVAAAAVGPDRQPSPEDLSEGRQVRPDSADLLRSARGQPETGDDLVEDQERAVPSRSRAARPRGSRARGGTTPMFAASGSRITAAISPGNRAKAASSAAPSL